MPVGNDEKQKCPWTPMEDEEFRRLTAANMPPEVIARKLNRPTQALKLRAYVIGLPLKWFKVSPQIDKSAQKKKSFVRSD